MMPLSICVQLYSHYQDQSKGEDGEAEQRQPMIKLNHDGEKATDRIDSKACFRWSSDKSFYSPHRITFKLRIIPNTDNKECGRVRGIEGNSVEH